MSIASRAAGAAALLAAPLLLALAGPLAAQSSSAPPANAAPAPGVAAGPLALARQGSFFVGGRDQRSDTLSNIPQFGSSGTVTIDQMYVRYQVPAEAGARRPLVLVHGCCLTGKTWETTPDGRMGWDEYFLRRGHPTYVVDQSWRGRSAANPAPINGVRAGRAEASTLPSVIVASQEGAWEIFRFGRRHPEVFPGMMFPLEAQAEFWKQMVPDWNYEPPYPNPTPAHLSALSRQLDGAVLVSHSQSGIYPFQSAALSRDGIAGIVSIEPGACPAADGNMAPYAGLPILILWGDYVNESSRWAPRLAGCTEFVRAANAAGGKAEQVMLADVGMPGASHMLMQDRNSLQVADWLAGWIARNVGDRR